VRLRAFTLIVGLIAAVAVLAVPATAGTPVPGQRIDLRVLLLSADGNEPSYQAWRAQLEREGVPFDAIVATNAPAITYAQLADGTTRARYEAVVVATGGLVYFNGSSYVSALEPSEWDALAELERTFGIRRVTAFAYPSPAYGLNSPTFSGLMTGVTGTLTPAAQPLFGYLQSQVPFDGSAWGYQATPVDPTTFRTFVSGPNGSSLVGAYMHPDGREELVVTVDSNPWMIHMQLLRHGMLSWATRGVYLGHARDYVELQIDDIFLEDDRWDMATNTTPEPSRRPIKMTAADALRAAAWQAASGMRLDFVYNGEGGESSRDLTARTLIAMRSLFRWTNHTYTHAQLDNASLATLKTEIQRNIDFARRKGLPIDATELVTGEHSGLGNPSMPQALNASGIRWFAADNSRQPTQYGLGLALSVPRHPTNVYYNVGRIAEQLDEYNYVYVPPPLGSCQNSATNTCRTTPATWSEYVQSEAAIMFGHVMGNDPRPHYFHQSNLAEDGVMYPVVNRLLSMHRSYFKTSLEQPRLSEAGSILRRQARWKQALANGAISGYIQDGQVVIQSAATIDVPLTGTSVGTLYGSQRSTWASVSAGTAAFTLSDPGNSSAPTVSGTARDGEVLTATNGNWTGTGPLTYAHQWQRCAGGVCASIAGAAAPTYTLTSADVGFTMRVVVTASGLTAWKSAASSQTAVVAAIPVSSGALPAISGTPQEGQVLHVSDGVWNGSGPITLAYQWYRCVGGTCTAIPGATAADYTLTAGDIGATMKAAVTATNAGGSAPAESAQTAVTTGIAPVSDSPPAVAGTPEVGQTLAADPGTWHGTAPISVAFQWVRCGGGGECTAIEGATAESYLVAPEDVGFSLALVVKSTNVSGSISVASATTGVVVEARPSG
jgi:heparan sulfate-N-deacetylase